MRIEKYELTKKNIYNVYLSNGEVLELNGKVITDNELLIKKDIDNELYDYIQNSRNERYYKYKNGNIFGKCKLDKYPIQKIINNEKCWGNLLAYIVNHHNSKKTDLKYPKDTLIYHNIRGQHQKKPA